MKAKLKGKITNAQMMNDGKTILNIELTGKVDSKSIDARPISMSAEFELKQLISNELKLGSIITVLITDDETLPLD